VSLGEATLASVILRCTARLLDLLDMRDATLVDDAASDEDWYANVLWIDRRKCLLLTHAGTLFPVFAAARSWCGPTAPAQATS
jgi:hypothetical protein